MENSTKNFAGDLRFYLKLSAKIILPYVLLEDF